ncbi:MAG: hypothetical protein IPP87_06040 [Ideonella sp.]|nr:hypothetical protein [Ideonella sp.]MBL0148305.1 hypothetical protein [Ideonella sp.]
MATPNYSYEKRQRELAKKRKAEDKRNKKTQRGDDAPGGPDESADPSATPPDQPPPAPPAS